MQPLSNKFSLVSCTSLAAHFGQCAPLNYYLWQLIASKLYIAYTTFYLISFSFEIKPSAFKLMLPFFQLCTRNSRQACKSLGSSTNYFISFSLIFDPFLCCSGMITIKFTGPMIFPWFFFRSFLPVLAWTTTEKPMEKFPGSPRYDAKHWAYVIIFYNNLGVRACK